MHAHCSDKCIHARLSLRQWSHDRSPAEKACCRGFTLIELLIVIAIIFTLVAIGFPIYGTALEKAKVSRAIADIHVVSTEIGTYQLFNKNLPLSLADLGKENVVDPYGHPYEYLNFSTEKGKGSFRKDRFLVPINSDYDLYSKGQDGDSVPPLTAAKSRDDIIRANDGGFIGLASGY